MKDALVHVTTPEQAERMRVIRNDCREFMTNDQHEITADEQQQWFASIKDDANILPFLYKPLPQQFYPEPFGFGLLRCVSDKWWLTGGLLKEWRGKGYGEGLFDDLAHYVHQMGHTAWLTVLETNDAGIATYKKLGFVVDSVMVAAQSVPVLVMSLQPVQALRMHKLVCPICRIVTNRTRGPRTVMGIVAEHGDCPGNGSRVPWIPMELQ